MSAVEYRAQQYDTLLMLCKVWRVSQLNKIVVSKQNQSKCVNCQKVYKILVKNKSFHARIAFQIIFKGALALKGNSSWPVTSPIL